MHCRTDDNYVVSTFDIVTAAEAATGNCAGDVVGIIALVSSPWRTGRDCTLADVLAGVVAALRFVFRHGRMDNGGPGGNWGTIVALARDVVIIDRSPWINMAAAMPNKTAWSCIILVPGSVMFEIATLGATRGISMTQTRAVA